MYQSLADKIYQDHGNNALFSSDFILADNKTPNPKADSYLNSLANTCLGNSGRTLTLTQDPAHLQYLQKCGMLDQPEQIIQLASNGERSYPHGSVEAVFLSAPQQTQALIRQGLHQAGSFALYPNFATQNSIAVARTLELPLGNIQASKQEHAEEISRLTHSKAFLRSQAQAYNYDIAPGRIIESKGRILTVQSLKQAITDLQTEVKANHNLSIEELNRVEYWLKFDSLSGGDGVVNLKSPLDMESLRSAVKQVEQIAWQCGMDPNDFHMPFVLEAGANSIPGKQLVGNINAQALIRPDGSLNFLDTSLQQTDHNGSYLGNSLPFVDPEALQAINKELVKIGALFSNTGYHGLIGGDAIVSKESHGTYLVEWFDLNPRMNGSQPFQEHFRLLQSQFPGVHGINANLEFPLPLDFATCKCFLGDLLFDQESLGILPVLFRSTAESAEHLVKTSIFAHSKEDLQALLTKIPSLGIKL